MVRLHLILSQICPVPPFYWKLHLNLPEISLRTNLTEVLDALFSLLTICFFRNALGVTTGEISSLAAETCAYMAIVHPDYTMLANRVAVTALHDRTFDDIRDVAETLFSYVDKVGRPAPLLADDVYEVIMKYADKINAKLDY